MAILHGIKMDGDGDDDAPSTRVCSRGSEG